MLTIDTRSLVAAHRERIWLSTINTGSTLFNPQPRGLGTFRRIPDFPFHERAATRAVGNNVVELVVDHSVPDMATHVLAVHVVRDDQILGEVWRSKCATDADHP